MKTRIIAFAVLLIALTLIASGLILGQDRDVYLKSSTVCLECVGIE